MTGIVFSDQEMAAFASLKSDAARRRWSRPSTDETIDPPTVNLALFLATLGIDIATASAALNRDEAELRDALTLVVDLAVEDADRERTRQERLRRDWARFAAGTAFEDRAAFAFEMEQSGLIETAPNIPESVAFDLNIGRSQDCVAIVWRLTARGEQAIAARENARAHSHGDSN
ncbi:MAG: hypothetical protein IBJ15_00055 [Alphaproteobacteria bacterium]|nr:hypothetical protein [Alphaproteobacteria bacterium]